MYYDVHTHAFHPKIAHKVTAQLQDHYGIPPVGSGTLEDLLERERKAGIDRFFLHTAATDPAQVIPANNWAIDLHSKHAEVVAFGTMHPSFDEPEKEFDRLESKGIQGIKFHPDFQGFRLDDPAFYELMEMINGRFLLMFHVGDTLPPDENPSCPRKLAAIRRAFPKSRIIAAHLGGYQHWKYVPEHLCGLDIWLDTSSSLPFISDAELAAIFDRHPKDRILFGSDYPLFDPSEAMHRLQTRLKLSDAQLETHLSAAQSLF
ncbi:amidohydrolase family protein [Paucidesulfovibrio longus]|uniref:amidohydrolase family protein n=1 Tax=Paucidesulfovibrio longus TaxID=889 RepID=UPI0003B58EAE|nr:amidohydrolase family protein [Paucidesulfovibrio longus]